MPLLRSAILLASSWPCHQCSHSNDLSRNKKRCSSCQAWRDGLAPLSAKGGASTSGAAASNVGLVNDDATCHNENGPPNNASPLRGGSLTKSRSWTKRKCGGGGGGVGGGGIGKGGALVVKDSSINRAWDRFGEVRGWVKRCPRDHVKEFLVFLDEVAAVGINNCQCLNCTLERLPT